MISGVDWSKLFNEQLFMGRGVTRKYADFFGYKIKTAFPRSSVLACPAGFSRIRVRLTCKRKPGKTSLGENDGGAAQVEAF